MAAATATATTIALNFHFDIVTVFVCKTSKRNFADPSKIIKAKPVHIESGVERERTREEMENFIINQKLTAHLFVNSMMDVVYETL